MLRACPSRESRHAGDGMIQREVRFQISDNRDDGGHSISVHPTLMNIYRAEGGEDIILAIAANCIRTIAKTDGLERAIERFIEVAINKTKPKRDDWPWNS